MCAAGAQIRADAAEKKLQESADQVLAAKKLAAQLDQQLTEHQSHHSHAVAAQQELRETQLQLLQQSHQDLSEKLQESSGRCAQLQVMPRHLEYSPSCNLKCKSWEKRV